MYGDPARVRALARQVQQLAADTRTQAVELDGSREVRWVSTDAERYRQRLHGEAEQVRGGAHELDEAAAALFAHADATQHRLAQIRAVERSFAGLVSDARRRLGSAVDDVEDAATTSARWVLDQAARAPAPGSLDWVGFAGRLGF